MLANNVIYATRNARKGVITEEGDSQIERINDYYCARGSICGCLFDMRVCRVVISGRHGIIAFQLVEKSNNGRIIPIPHSNHKKIPFYESKTTGAKVQKSERSAVVRNSQKFTKQ